MNKNWAGDWVYDARERHVLHHAAMNLRPEQLVSIHDYMCAAYKLLDEGVSRTALDEKMRYHIAATLTGAHRFASRPTRSQRKHGAENEAAETADTDDDED